MIKVKYPETKSENGIRPGRFPPFETVATVIAVATSQTKYEYDHEHFAHRTDHTRDERFRVTFAFTDEEGDKCSDTQTFYGGDMFPKEIGDKVLGVAYMTQWGFRWSFRMTHLLKG